MSYFSVCHCYEIVTLLRDFSRPLNIILCTGMYVPYSQPNGLASPDETSHRESPLPGECFSIKGQSRRCEKWRVTVMG